MVVTLSKTEIHEGNTPTLKHATVLKDDKAPHLTFENSMIRLRETKYKIREVYRNR